MYYEALREEKARNNNPLRLRFKFLHGTLMPCLIRLGCRRADHIFCLNSREAAYLEQNNWCGRETISVIANGVSDQYFHDRTHTREPRTLLFVGQWLEMKGIHYLIDAFTSLARKMPRLILRCAGTLVDEATVLANFPEEVRRQVAVRPHLSRDEMASEYQAADIFVFPTLSEGSSNALLEAMASALPIVTTRVGAASDFLRDDENALLVPIRDAGAVAGSVQRLVADQSLRERVGRAAQATAAQYKLARVHENLVALLEGVVGNGRSTR
jgi:glycosyltransferase involved in cell wall biosynthesis